MWILTAAAIVFGLLAILFAPESLNIPMGYYFAKPLATISIFLLAWTLRGKGGDPDYSRWILIGLVFSLLGDVALMFTDQIKIMFAVGIGLFLTAHIFYILAFWKRFRLRILDILPLIFFVPYAVLMFWILRDGASIQGLGEAVLGYIIIITIMGWRAISTWWHDAYHRGQRGLIAAGAILFMISDSLLGLHVFYKHLWLSSVFVLSTYYLAQLCFAWSIRKSAAS